MGGDIFDVNAEYIWQGHSWYAFLSSFSSSPPPLTSPLTPILSLLSVPPAPNALFKACDDFCLANGGGREVVDIHQISSKQINLGAALCSGMLPSSPSRLPLLKLSLLTLFLSLSHPTYIH